MEFALNLIWACTAALVLAGVYRSVGRHAVRRAASRRRPVSPASAMLLAALLCLILLPAISGTDDMLSASQATLPLNGQTWRMLWEDAAAGLDLLLATAAWLLLAMGLRAESRRPRQFTPALHPLAGRLARTLRLRPPPCAA